jgi:hypothetical protein
MFRTAVPLRVLAVLAVGALALGVLVLRPQPAAAQFPDYSNLYSEYLITTTTITRTQPSLSAPIYTTLQPNTIVYVISRFFTQDGIYWLQLRDPAGNYLGFVPASGPGVNPVGLQFAGTGITVGGYPRYITGYSPYVTVTPFINPFTVVPRQIFPRTTPVFVPSVGFFQ